MCNTLLYAFVCFAVDASYTFFIAFPIRMFMNHFIVTESIGIGVDFILLRMNYMQAGIQIVLLFLIYRFGYQKSLLACLGAVIVSFVISVSLFTASFLGSLRLLLP